MWYLQVNVQFLMEMMKCYNLWVRNPGLVTLVHHDQLDKVMTPWLPDRGSM